jgi:[ribosomal protein S5]-alanine N-acetyltransferase
MLSLNFTPFPELRTQRLVLRRLAPADARTLATIRSNKEVNQYIDRAPEMTAEEAEKFIEKINGNIDRNESLVWGMVPENATEIIGTILLWNMNAEKQYAEVGYEMLPAYQGKGLAREALHTVLDYGFNTLHFTTIEGYVHYENGRSFNLLQKFGFTKDRLLIENGEETNLVIYVRNAPYP